MPLLVRDAESRDLDSLVQNCIGVARESEGLEPDAARVRIAVQAALEDPSKARYLVAEADGAVVGSLFITYEWSDWTCGWYWWIQGVFVDPARRGQGVYSRLYEAVHERALAAGDVRKIRLYVDRHNEAGLRAYRGHGMTKTEYQIFEAPVS